MNFVRSSRKSLRSALAPLLAASTLLATPEQASAEMHPLFDEDATHRVFTRYGGTTEVDLSGFLADGVDAASVTFSLSGICVNQSDYYSSIDIQDGKLVAVSNSAGHVHGGSEPETRCTVIGASGDGHSEERQFDLYLVSDRLPPPLPDGAVIPEAASCGTGLRLRMNLPSGNVYLRLGWREAGTGGAFTFRLVSGVSSGDVLTVPDLKTGTRYEFGVSRITRQAFDLFRGSGTGHPLTLIAMQAPPSKWVGRLSGSGLGKRVNVVADTPPEECPPPPPPRPRPPPPEPPRLSIDKTTPREVVERDALIPFAIRLEHRGGSAAGALSIVDTLPEGLVFVPGTARLDGTEHAVVLDGGVVTFEEIRVPANAEVVATLAARVTPDAEPGTFVNSAVAREHRFGVVVGPATATVRVLHRLSIAKSTPREVVERDALIPFTVRLANGDGTETGPLSIVDTLPEGLVLVPGSARLDGMDHAVVVDGGTVTFADVRVPANAEVVATLAARVSPEAEPGVFVNEAVARDPRFGVVAGPATATVRVLHRLSIAKSTPREVIERDALIPFTVRLANGDGTGTGPLSIVDTLPEGLVFVPGSARLDGKEHAAVVDGGTVTFEGIRVPANAEVVATLAARVSPEAEPGTFVNSAVALDPGFGVVAGPATATVLVMPEAGRHCGDVVGRVFDDLDGDGHQDSFEPGNNPPGISDQTYRGAKHGGEAGPEVTQERGLPGVRLVTLDGIVITTDGNGLFSVPCAALPAGRGSNFLLRLDTRTLPAGFGMTTENPRVMRLTPGMLVEMNFGAWLERIVRVDLGHRAFTAAGGLSSRLLDGLGALATELAGNTGRVALVHHVPADADGADVAAARAAMDRVEAELRARFRDRAGRGSLAISQTIAREGR